MMKATTSPSYQMSSTEERREFFDMLPVRGNVDAVIVISLRHRRQ